MHIKPPPKKSSTFSSIKIIFEKCQNIFKIVPRLKSVSVQVNGENARPATVCFSLNNIIKAILKITGQPILYNYYRFSDRKIKLHHNNTLAVRRIEKVDITSLFFVYFVVVFLQAIRVKIFLQKSWHYEIFVMNSFSLGSDWSVDPPPSFSNVTECNNCVRTLYYIISIRSIILLSVLPGSRWTYGLL